MLSACLLDVFWTAVVKCRVIAGLLLRNWCVFDSGKLLVVRGSFTAFGHPEENSLMEFYALSHRTFEKIKIRKIAEF